MLDFDPDNQTGNLLDQLPNLTDFMKTNSTRSDTNRAAFLAALRYAEGTQSDEGYRALFGWRLGNGKTFSSFADHPKQFFNYTNLAGAVIRTSAAGAYQITATTYDLLCKKYGFTGFGPDVQDAMAMQLIDEKNALDDIDSGRIESAISKCRRVWASLPDSGVNQPTRSLQSVVAAYQKAGGMLA
ncbi:glycoside hydrolase family 104 protein [Undibacterium sp. Ren11W]|uniref:glycoside hydrolase family 24 protein n=1 Tax=Undibacterium sp. Ren11W TaxID=3413045 RepID=UPI003BF35A49